MAGDPKPEYFPSFTKTWRSQPYQFVSPTRAELSAAGRHVVITGGGTGLGKAIAIAFAQAGAAAVTILGRRVDRLISSAAEISAAGTAKLDVQTFGVDLLQRAQLDAALDTAVANAGAIDIMVSNAGARPDLGPLATYDADHLRAGLELNLMTALNAIQAFLHRKGPNPVLISVSTASAHVAPWPDLTGYNVSKAANQKLLDCVAAEHSEVHVVSYHPGGVRTELNNLAQHPAPDSKLLSGGFAVWLASPEATFLRGKIVWANFDAEELLERAEEIKSTRLLTWLVDGIPA